MARSAVADRERQCVILGIETSCDETAAARRHRRRRDPRRTSSPRRPSCTPATAASCPEVASRRHLELVVAGRPRGARRGGRRRSTTSTRVARHARARADRRAARRRSPPRRRSPGRAAAARRRSTTCTATSPRSTSQPEPLEPPFLCLLASGGHTLLLDVRDRAGFDVLGHDARRRRRRGVRQGRAPARPRLPGRRGDRPARARRRSRGVRRSRSRACRASTSPSPGVKTALLYAVRDLDADGARARAAPTSRRRYQRAIVARARRADARRRSSSGASGSRSSAASPRTPSCAPRCRTRPLAPLALCTDNAAMIASAAPLHRAAAADPLRLDAYAVA